MSIYMSRAELEEISEGLITAYANKFNVLSFISSYAVAKLSGLEPMGYYFKPFTSHSLIVAISVVILIVHTNIVLIYRAKKKANCK